MEQNNTSIDKLQVFKKLVLNKYFLTIFFFTIWMVFFDNTSWLVIRDLDKEIQKHEEQLEYYKKEFEKNDSFYRKLTQDKSEKEKFARENYFMKKSNEEIFILVIDSTALPQQKKK